MMEPYSVLMSVYRKDNPAFLQVALDSMCSQTVPPDEIVLVEDGPLSDELYAVVEQYSSQLGERLHLVILPENQGLGPALNQGLLQCSHELVARMDSDDISVPNRCELQLRYLQEHPEVAVVGGQIVEFIGSMDHLAGRRTVPLTDAELKAFMKKRCPMNHVSVMYKKSAVLTAGNYQACFWNEDTYLWIRMAQAGMKFGNLPEDLVMVRVGEEMYQRRGGMKYFRSETMLQGLMLKNGMISLPRYLINVLERLVVQVLLPNRLRGWVFRKLARSGAGEDMKP